MKKVFGLETSELFFRFLQAEFYTLCAKVISSKHSFLELKTKNPSQLIFPWTILKYERIASDSIDDKILVSASSTHPQNFRRQLEYLKSNCKILALSDLVDSIKKGMEISPETVAITIDGGFKDNFDSAFPILKELNLPATFFLPTDLIDTPRLVWQDQVAAAIFILIDSGRQFPLLQSIEPRIALNLKVDFDRTQNKILLARGVVAAIEIVPPSQRDFCMHEISNLIEGIRYETPQRVYMTWEEVRKCHVEGIDIGSLGTIGTPLLELSREELASELHLSYETLFSNGINPSRIFSLPRGEITADSENFLFQMGFPYVVGEKYFTPLPSTERTQILKRISINDSNSKSLDRFKCRIAEVRKPFSKERY